MLSALVFLFYSLIGYLIFGYNGEGDREAGMIMAERIHDGVRAELSGPVLMARGLAKDTLLRDLLKQEGQLSQGEMVKVVKQFLGEWRRCAEYGSIFLVSEQTHRYYTDTGLGKIVNPEGDSHDRWYSNFINTNLPYAIDVDTDEVHGDQWTIFVNVRVEDTDGTLLGVCGVGISVESLQEMFARYEQAYGVKVHLTNVDGLVKVDVDNINIETTYCSSDNYLEEEDFQYTRNGFRGFTIIRYIPELNWYLYVRGDHSRAVYRHSEVGRALISVLMFLTLAIISFVLFRNADGADGKRMLDRLTGAPNRSYFGQAYGERGIINTTRYKSIAVFDVDHFRVYNEVMDGDEILLFVTDLVRKYVGEKGELYRWGEDQFVLLMEWSEEFAYGILKEFCRKVELDGRVTVSIGVSSIRLSDKIRRNYYRAVQGCFLVKEMGGNGIKRN